jgi:adenylate kinase family enzyme
MPLTRKAKSGVSLRSTQLLPAGYGWRYVICNRMQYRKIHIIGGPGSGKSYIAKKLSTLCDIHSYDLDDIFWDRAANDYGTKAHEEDRVTALCEILKKNSWIIEGVYYRWLSQAFEDADIIIILSPSKYIRHWRISKRFIKRKFDIIPSKKETLRDFLNLVKWNQKFDSDNLIRIRKFIAGHELKALECKKFQEILRIINIT